MTNIKQFIEKFRKYQSGEISPSEINDLLIGMKQGNFEKWLDEEWDNVTDTMDKETTERIFAKIQQKVAEKEAQKSRKARIIQLFQSSMSRVAAIALILIIAGVGYWHFNKNAEPQWLKVVANDNVMQLTLPDSSKVWLCRNSVLQYPENFADGSRDVKLIGEAYFEVEHDTGHPFIVNANRVCIKVTGTKFSVCDISKMQTCKVILAEGSVNVNKTTEKNGRVYQLRPNDSYTLYASGKEEISTVDASTLQGWKEGYYQFSNEPLEDVLHRLSTFYGKQIICDSRIKNLKVSGMIFFKDSLGVALDDLCHIDEIQWSVKNGNYKIEMR